MDKDSGESPAYREIGGLFSTEIWWRDRYPAIEEHGYRLRPRYCPDWQPSWKTSGKDFFVTEDGQASLERAAMDGTRVQDYKQVMFKKVLPEEGPHELYITDLFSSPGLKDDPANHCVPLLDLIELPEDGGKLMVMPLLRPFNNPRFQTYGEFVAFFLQICEGLKFMHQRNVAHRDCTANNIMLDPSGMYPKGYHPTKIDRSYDFKRQAKRYTRTERAPRYYFIDFGLSRRYPSRNVSDESLRGGDKSAPEHENRGWCNPFHTDIYYLGNVVREHFLKKYNGFGFMQKLIDDMTNPEPEKRPVIEEVVERFGLIRDSLSTIKLYSKITRKKDSKLLVMFWHARQLTRTALYITQRLPAIPMP